MKVDEKKLEELHLYFTKEKGSTEQDAVMKKIGTTEESVKDAYVDALREKYPKIYGSVEKETQPKEISKKDFTYALVNEQGFSEELEVMAIQGNVVHLKKIIPTDIVTVKIGGADVPVDILELRRADKTEQRHGVSVATLLVMAQVAKG